MDEKLQRLYNDIQDGLAAERLYDKLEKFFEEARKELFNEWKIQNSNWDEIKSILNALDRLEAIFLRKIENAKIANEDINQEFKEE